jgi:hypothetical protein
LSGGRVDRRLAAILAADVAGYSRLIGGDEEGTLGRLRSIRAEVIDPNIHEHRGRLVKTTGDVLLIEFASVIDALRCAIEVQREMSRTRAAHRAGSVGLATTLYPHTRRAEACPHHHQPSSVDINPADLWRASMVVLVPENRPPDHKALSAERRIAFLEPASLRPWIPLPARGLFQSSSAPGGHAEPSARWGRLEHMGRSAGQTEMDALGDLREDIRTLGAGGRESQRGFRASGDADFTSARCVNPDQPIKTAVAQRRRP